MDHWADPVLERLAIRASNITTVPPHHSEDLQVIHYDPAQHYHAHWDHIGDDAADQKSWWRGVKDGHPEDNRYLTLLLYLNDVNDGGETVCCLISLLNKTRSFIIITHHRCFPVRILRGVLLLTDTTSECAPPPILHCAYLSLTAPFIQFPSPHLSLLSGQTKAWQCCAFLQHCGGRSGNRTS